MSARIRPRHEAAGRIKRGIKAANKGDMSTRTIGYNGINHQTGRQKLFNGLTDPGLPSALESRNFVYVDNGYFDRRNCFRLIRGAFHLTELLDRPGDRWDRLEIKVCPWKTSGRYIVVIPPGEWYIKLLGCKKWLASTRNELEKHTDREIIVKEGKGGLEEMLQHAWAMVTYGSVAGVEAAILGVPVFSGPICPTTPISAGKLEDIERPVYHDRRPWLCSLAYANWRVNETSKIHLKDYNYTCES